MVLYKLLLFSILNIININTIFIILPSTVSIPRVKNKRQKQGLGVIIIIIINIIQTDCMQIGCNCQSV